MTDRLPTELWIAAHIRQCAAKAIPVYVAHKGAPAAGTIMVRIAIRGAGSKILNQSRDEEGNIGWMNPFDSEIVDEARAEQYIQTSIARDPDVWVIEVEDNSGKNPFEGKILK